MNQGNLVVFDLQQINKEIVETALAINPDVQFAYRFDNDYFVLNPKKDELYQVYGGYHILEATPEDNRPRSRFLRWPIGKAPESKELVYLVVNPDENYHYKVIITCYGILGRDFADKLIEGLILRDIDVILIVKTYEKTAKVKR